MRQQTKVNDNIYKIQTKQESEENEDWGDTHEIDHVNSCLQSSLLGSKYEFEKKATPLPYLAKLSGYVRKDL